MTLDRGARIDPEKIKNRIFQENLRRLLIWASVGADADNGLWSIYGTRLGIYVTNLTDDFVMSNISDYDWFNEYFNSLVLPQFAVEPSAMNSVTCFRTGVTYDEAKLRCESSRIKDELRKGLGVDIADLDAEQSKFFKFVCRPQLRQSKNPLTTENE